MISLRSGKNPSVIITNCESEIDMVVMEAWIKQRAIGWDQILNSCLSKKWNRAQGVYYNNNPLT